MTDAKHTQVDAPEQPKLPCYRAEDLVEGGQSAHITLGDQFYTLRITRAGKLILTK